jgi:hypothetical protein
MLYVVYHSPGDIADRIAATTIDFAAFGKSADRNSVVLRVCKGKYRNRGA